MNSASKTAQKTFELANNVATVDPDQIYQYNAAEQKEWNNKRPWRTDPHHFKKVKVSATALIKMVMHARSGGAYEVMGLMQGKLGGFCFVLRKVAEFKDGDTFIVLDAFPLPVQGTETRVNAGNEGMEFAVVYQEGCKNVGRLENVVGWYHSHPGYGCWLSGIDVATQMVNQSHQDPFLAIVIDPNRTVSAGRVEIGAFRTYPENYTPPNASASEYQSIPLNKIEDFGVHASRYYNLEISHFKSSLDSKLLDLLWNKYWVMTLSQSPLVTNRAYTTAQIEDLTDKLGRSEASVSSSRPQMAHLCPEVVAMKASAASSSTSGKGKEKAAPATEDASSAPKTEETQLGKAIRDSGKVAAECQHGLLNQILKDTVFNLNKGKSLAGSS